MKDTNERQYRTKMNAVVENNTRFNRNLNRSE